MHYVFPPQFMGRNFFVQSRASKLGFGQIKDLRLKIKVKKREICKVGFCALLMSSRTVVTNITARVRDLCGLKNIHIIRTTNRVRTLRTKIT
ncbi:MAG: hypothetical protein UV19_C0012G0010 [Parcubacteria group bacterium GW2011_GWA2_42_28]|nr:MAG: hypothetical protein UV19_C0012G0010 [Parcubacteria group bacterium GW2011_GWA2_42_28]